VYVTLAIEGFEGASFAELQNDPGARHPVSALAVNQMSDDFERAPRVFPFIAERPHFGKITQECVESGGSAREKRYSLL
jgi:hypothetical protein